MIEAAEPWAGNTLIVFQRSHGQWENFCELGGALFRRGTINTPPLLTTSFEAFSDSRSNLYSIIVLLSLSCIPTDAYQEESQKSVTDAPDSLFNRVLDVLCHPIRPKEMENNKKWRP